MAPRLDAFGHVAHKADIDADGFVTVADAALVLESIGDDDADPTKDQNDGCLIWADDVAAIKAYQRDTGERFLGNISVLVPKYLPAAPSQGDDPNE